MIGVWRFSLLGYPVSLARPLHLALAALALLLAALVILRALGRQRALTRFVAAPFAARLAPGVGRARPLGEGLLASLGLVLFAVALAQPQCGTRSELTRRRGIDLVVALDASKSMLARDVQPSRLERAKLELLTLLDELEGDRVGIVVFAGDAFIQCPLTSDYAAAKLFLRAVDPEQMAQGGTHLGAALALSLRLLEGAERGATEKVVVLLSDGEDLAGETDPAVTALRQAGVAVLAVGIGSESGEPIPEVDRHGAVVGYKKDPAGETVLTRLDRTGLAAIAEATGGELFHQPQGVAMSEVIARIDRLQKSELESRVTTRYDERFQPFAAAGLLLWTLGLFVGAERRRP